ncbi:hypothetical protein OOK36_26730 [Streptomyces sp. NBC_00365]|uniref:hypothetical protein n=1 Tax=Streptomyces sp. NBC_00365 TaxID=2975726 RepID=UPI002254E111|nr:hypothetical protein [Streptomyces sp. NBC_00365]MCX5092409.1 hypothetical protein [Streptomyces sp. NBC_00365]
MRYDWSEAEQALGAPLPADFKELRRSFPEWGAFRDHVVLLKAQGGSESVPANHETLLKAVRGNPGSRRMFQPYGILRAGEAESSKGLVQWGYSFIEEEYYWLADTATDPSTWPIAARVDPLESFRRFDMTASEFIYRVVADVEFSPFGIAGSVGEPYCLTY